MSGLESFFAQIMDIHPLAALDPDAQLLIWLIILLAAALNLLIGYGLRLPDSAIGGFLMGFYAINFFGSFGNAQNIWIVALIVGIMVGLLSLALYRLGESFLSFAALFATFASAGLLQRPEIGLAALITALVLAVLTLTPFGERPVIILVTSVCGGWWTVTALLAILAINGYDLSGYLSPMIYFWIRLAAALLLAVLGITVQSAATRARDRRVRDRKARRGSDDYGGGSSREDYTPVDYVGTDPRYNTRQVSVAEPASQNGYENRDGRCGHDEYDGSDYGDTRDYDRSRDYLTGFEDTGNYVGDAESYSSAGAYDTRGNSRILNTAAAPEPAVSTGSARDYSSDSKEKLPETDSQAGIQTVNNRIAYEVARIYADSKKGDAESGPSSDFSASRASEIHATKIFAGAKAESRSVSGETKVFAGIKKSSAEEETKPIDKT